MKKLFVFLLALICLFNVAACSEEQDPFFDKVVEDFGVFKDVESYDITSTAQSFDEQKFKFHGRYYKDRNLNATWISFTNSGFEVTFFGTALEGDFFATRADDVKSRPYVAVAVDNDYDPDKALPVQFAVGGKYSNGEYTDGGLSEHKHVVLCHGLEEGVHTVRIYKRSECQNSRLAIKSVSTDGEMLEVNAKPLDLKMEFFGDSVTCGYAVESDSYYERFTTRTENGMKTYANYCANLLNADISSVCAGGYPLYKSIYSQYNNPNDIPSLFTMAEFEYQTSFDHEWDNSLYVPDVVVIALGANDGSVLNQLAAGGAEYNEFLTTFRATYYSFIETIFAAYPDTLVVISSEILHIADVFENIADEVATDLKAQGKRVLRVRYQAESLAKDRTYPGEGHPNAEMQLIAGHELAKAIAEELGTEFEDGFFDCYAVNN